MHPNLAPDALNEIVEKLAPRLSPATQFVCKEEDTKTFGKSDRDDVLTIHHSNTEIKTVYFDTDGTYKDDRPVNWRDGYSKNRHVSEWNWAVLENAVKGAADTEPKLVQTVYLRSKQLYVAVRLAVGLPAY